MGPSRQPDAAVALRRDPYAAFHVRDYRRYMFGWIIYLVGMRIQSVAIGWETYQRTGEALALGIVGLVQALPAIGLAVPAGYLADRFSRRTLMMLSTLGMAATSVGLAALSFAQGPVSWICVLLFLDAVAKALGRPARFALLPQLVPVEVFPNAVTWRTSLMQLSSVVGPAIGGFVVAGSVPAAYILNTVGSLAFVALLFRVNERRVTRQPGRISWRTVLAGMRFVWGTRLILAMISLDMLAVLLGGAVYLMPIFAENIL